MAREIKGRKHHGRLSLASLSLAGMLLLSATTASAADPGSGRSCMGHEGSDISPPGSSSEFPGGMPEFKAAVADLLGGAPFGSFVGGVFAKLHEGSHEACDEAVE